jgi:hypothetical protein
MLDIVYTIFFTSVKGIGIKDEEDAQDNNDFAII